jgi:hypothetical protein
MATVRRKHARGDTDETIVEKGNIYFAYRPRVEGSEAEGARDVRGRRFATADPHLLDDEDAEFILIGARVDPERAYDLDIETEHETADKADIFRQLKTARGGHPLDPLLTGDWR